MTGREKLLAEDKKKRIYYKNYGICEVCQKQVPMQEAQIAHRIGQTKVNLKKYGKETIHSFHNLALVCSLECNSKVDITYNPQKVLDVLQKIIEEEL